jgi:sialic acid synthase SpsE
MIIEGRRLSHAHPRYTLAEAGVNHTGEIECAVALVAAAAAAGADAVRFRAFSADRLVTPDAPVAPYQRS